MTFSGKFIKIYLKRDSYLTADSCTLMLGSDKHFSIWSMRLSVSMIYKKIKHGKLSAQSKQTKQMLSIKMQRLMDSDGFGPVLVRPMILCMSPCVSIPSKVKKFAWLC